MPGSCHYCGTMVRELRPYGPGGTDLCHPCMLASPEREAEASRQFEARLDAAAAVGGGVVTIGGADGPQPLTPVN